MPVHTMGANLDRIDTVQEWESIVTVRLEALQRRLGKSNAEPTTDEQVNSTPD